MSKPVSLEVKQRLTQLLDRITRPPFDAEQRFVVRGIEVLERIGSPEARRILESLSKGAPTARITREARLAQSR